LRFRHVPPKVPGREKKRPQLVFRRSVPFDKPLNELALSNPSDVTSRYSISATKVGSTHVAFGFLMGLLNLLFGLPTVSSCLRIWLEAVRDHPVPTFPM
jgi:hypothetical protein